MAREAIFIGYRRDDTADVAGRIFDALESRFGRDRIFKDVDNLRPGADFGEYIKTILPRCRVALILIGPNWVNAQDEDGRRRLDDPNDWVRIEIEIALAAGDLDVVPVLINGARMPRAEELPPSLHPLLRRHAATIRRDPDFRDDIDRLAKALQASVRTGSVDLSEIGSGAAAPQNRRRRGALVTAALLSAVALLIGFSFGWARLFDIESRAYACSGLLRYGGQNIDHATLRLESRNWPRALWPAGWSASQGHWEGNGSLELPSGFRIKFYDNEGHGSGTVMLFDERDSESSRGSVGSFHAGGLLRYGGSKLQCVTAS